MILLLLLYFYGNCHKFFTYWPSLNSYIADNTANLLILIYKYYFRVLIYEILTVRQTVSTQLLICILFVVKCFYLTGFRRLGNRPTANFEK